MGVKITVSLMQPHYSQVVEVLNYAQQHWLPIVVKLPTLASDMILQVSIQPRVSINNDSTLFGFIGVTQTAG